MDLHLQDQVCTIVGGASGIGLAIANAFHAEGCRVGIVDRDETALEALAQFETFAGDVTSYASMCESRDFFLESFGAVHHVVVAAGAGSGKFGFPFWNLTPGDWPHVIDVNLLGPVNVAHAYARELTEQRLGTMLFIVSVAGQIGSQTDPPYSAAKAAVVNFMQCAAKDLAPFNVRANALSPGMVQTPLNRSVWAAGQELLAEDQRQDYEEWAADKIQKISPLGRWQTPEEFGAIATYLASHHACNITGQTLNIDGGQVMHS